MTVVFPNMGNLTTILCAFMRTVGGSFVGPFATSGETADLGTRYAPHDACMPMKLVLGNFLEGWHRGADTALFFGGCGPCCFGYFAETFGLIFRQNNIPMRVIALENNRHGLHDALRFLSSASQKPLRRCLPALATGLSCAKWLDRYEQSVLHKRAEIGDPAEAKRLRDFDQEMQTNMQQAPSLRALLLLAKQGVRQLETFQSDRVPNVKIGIVGDIYSVIDPFSNQQIQARLADLGVYSCRSMTISSWLDDKLLHRPQHWKRDADRLLPQHVGGFARETVGHAARWAGMDFDGIIELYPLNCMPESVARNILPRVSERCSTPVMSLVMDEMSAEAGFLTRLEAFVQMIVRKKEAEVERTVSGD